jgi:hypothetical protein
MYGDGFGMINPAIICRNHQDPEILLFPLQEGIPEAGWLQHNRIRNPGKSCTGERRPGFPGIHLLASSRKCLQITSCRHCGSCSTPYFKKPSSVQAYDSFVWFMVSESLRKMEESIQII